VAVPKDNRNVRSRPGSCRTSKPVMAGRTVSRNSATGWRSSLLNAPEYTPHSEYPSRVRVWLQPLHLSSFHSPAGAADGIARSHTQASNGSELRMRGQVTVTRWSWLPSLTQDRAPPSSMDPSTTWTLPAPLMPMVTPTWPALAGTVVAESRPAVVSRPASRARRPRAVVLTLCS
jgi:hypothetical protein